MKLQLLCDGETLFDSTTDQYKASAIDLTEQVNTTNTLSFTLPPFNPNYGIPNKMTSVIELLRNDVLIFEGRVLYTDDDIMNNRTFTCEGSLAYLLDSIVRPVTSQDMTILEYFTYLINQHNAQVEEQKQFQVGMVTVTNSTDNVYRIDNTYQNTLTVLQEKLVNRLGGYLVVRIENGVRYLDYLEEYGTTSSQTIEFQKNILDVTQRISAENIITALIPLGATNEETSLPLTIESVNDGKDYIFDQTAVNLFGYIYGKNTWEDVTIPQNLLTKGQEFLQENITASWSIEVSAVDLAMLGVNINFLDIGMSTPVISAPHGLDQDFTIKKKETNFLQPQNSTITLDTVIKRNTDQVSTADRTLSQMNQENTDRFMAIVKNQTNLITGGAGGNMQYGFNDAGLPSELYFMDNPDKELAKNVLRMNMNGIGFSSNGIDGPYETAWTLDGVFNAKYITTGILGVQDGKSSWWDLVNGVLNVFGSFTQLNSDGTISIAILQNAIWLYKLNNNGAYLGMLDALTDPSDTSKAILSLHCSTTDSVMIGVETNSSAQNRQVRACITCDAQSILAGNPPYIANTWSGTIQLLDTTVTVTNGLITNVT